MPRRTTGVARQLYESRVTTEYTEALRRRASGSLDSIDPFSLSHYEVASDTKTLRASVSSVVNPPADHAIQVNIGRPEHSKCMSIAEAESHVHESCATSVRRMFQPLR
jgi:hypothetical protein